MAKTTPTSRIPPGSALVGAGRKSVLDNCELVYWDALKERFVERVNAAYGRMLVNYQSPMRSNINIRNLIPVGEYNYESSIVTVTNLAILKQWLGKNALSSEDLFLRPDGAEVWREYLQKLKSPA